MSNSAIDWMLIIGGFLALFMAETTIAMVFFCSVLVMSRMDEHD